MRIIQIIDYKIFGADWPDIARKAEKHADMLWFRIKNEPDAVIKAECEKLKNMLPEFRLFLSGRADIASQYGFAGVQLGASTVSVAEVRAKYPGLEIGYSAHSLDEINRIGADFFTLSPIFMTEKDYEVKPLGAVDVRAIDKRIYALGGITADNVSMLKDKGFAGVAGISFHKELELIHNYLYYLF